LYLSLCIYQTETLFDILGLNYEDDSKSIKEKVLINFINSIIKYLITYSGGIPTSPPTPDLHFKLPDYSMYNSDSDSELWEADDESM
jgi:hypothetical protein